jgi:hypothetical protein
MGFISKVNVQDLEHSCELATLLRVLLDDAIGHVAAAECVPCHHETGAHSPPAFDPSANSFVLSIGGDRLFKISVAELDESPLGESMKRGRESDTPALAMVGQADDQD